jgi:hypothetical protein
MLVQANLCDGFIDGFELLQQSAMTGVRDASFAGYPVDL